MCLVVIATDGSGGGRARANPAARLDGELDLIRRYDVSLRAGERDGDVAAAAGMGQLDS